MVNWFPWGGGGEPCGIRGRILMSRFCSSIPQHLGPVVWAPQLLVTSKTRRSLVTSKTRVSLVAGSVAQKTLNARVALRSLITTDLSRQGQRTPQGGRRIGSWLCVTVLRTEAGLSHCLFPLDPSHLLLLCPNLWVVIGPERHGSPDVNGSRKEWAIYTVYVSRIPGFLYIIYVLSSLQIMANVLDISTYFLLGKCKGF